MKNNLKIIVAVVVMVGVVFWAVNSVRASSYSGTNLNFAVGSGVVTLTNPSNTAVDAQFLSTSARSFNVSSSIEGVSGASTRQNIDNKVSQLFTFALPPGESVLTVTRGTNVSFSGNTNSSLRATVEPLSAGEVNTTLIAAAVVVIVGLFYISRSTGHSWINRIWKKAPEPVVIAAPETPAGERSNKGRDGRMYSNYGAKD